MKVLLFTLPALVMANLDSCQRLSARSSVFNNNGYQWLSMWDNGNGMTGCGTSWCTNPSYMRTYQKAEQVCSDANMRVCNIAELRQGAAASTGCTWDSAEVWSSTKCDISSVWTFHHATKNSVCRSAVSSAHQIRCCADLATPAPTASPTPQEVVEILVDAAPTTIAYVDKGRYAYDSRRIADRACTDNGYDGLCFKAQMDGVQNCKNGYMADFVGYYMNVATQACGNKIGFVGGWDGAGAYCCKDYVPPQPPNPLIVDPAPQPSNPLIVDPIVEPAPNGTEFNSGIGLWEFGNIDDVVYKCHQVNNLCFANSASNRGKWAIADYPDTNLGAKEEILVGDGTFTFDDTQAVFTAATGAEYNWPWECDCSAK